jgi:F-type H+-transporting ATPase subunit alpha
MDVHHKDLIAASLSPLESLADEFAPEMKVVERGEVVDLASGIAQITGLPGLGYQELVRITADDGTIRPGMAVNLDADTASIILFDDPRGIASGAEVRRTGGVLDVPVGEGLIGRVTDGLGRPLDDLGPLVFTERWPIEREAPDIMDRQAVTVPLETGILAIDSMIPIGRGQRELIIGDRQCGKTSIAVDAIVNQKGKNVTAIYCAIGISMSTVAEVISDLRANGAMAYTIVVAVSGDSTAGLNFIAPFAATSMAEYFMSRGRDVLIVYDDLIHHARSYRELSLLLRRPPAREAFPGDIFYLHSRLLERSTRLSEEKGGGSITALPIAETEAQNISAYIPTNLISITDGQIYVSPRLFRQAQLPAIDVLKSVSRVGGQAQSPGLRTLSGELRLSFAQFEELETFSRLDTALDDSTRKTLERGLRVREILKQPLLSPLTAGQQILLLTVLNAGVLDELPSAGINAARSDFFKEVNASAPSLMQRLEAGETPAAEDKTAIITIAQKIFRPV